MTVYVDNFRAPARVGRITGRWSHLVTDNPDLTELHEFAARIGLQRRWFQTGKHAYRPHYDVTDTKRTAAIAAGAVPIDITELADVLARARNAESGKDTA
ncbi:MAG: DUF4031 domain-containing protein [Umezawaea sp.]